MLNSHAVLKVGAVLVLALVFIFVFPSQAAAESADESFASEASAR